ncbi:hypothetical protein GpartN1_g4021.t1 [Galdieria partita]|uniref:Rhodanese domain-containing protein n=1 Tax=Galdieria partita TaxID=83374 RepID=A0A9C7PXI5_9RHOD|nr:hypothetical protein GpartN1_g4021.t1 [Galdieria partita]
MFINLINFLAPLGLKSNGNTWHRGVSRCMKPVFSQRYFRASPAFNCSVESIHPSEAHQKKLRDSWKHLDVRTEEEYSAGHAKDSICVPVMIKGKEGKLEENPLFLKDVCKVFKKDDKILVSCLKGPRAIKAIEKLRQAGFSQVLNVEGGFEKWKESALPVEK